MDSASPHLFVPGWAGSGPDHWQSIWLRELGGDRMELDDWLDPRPDAWIAALDNAISNVARRDPRPPVLIAHSLGCIAIALWARACGRPIRAAFLVAPADVETAPCLPRLRAFGPVPRAPLPFSSLVVASDDDRYVSPSRADAFATAWGSDLRLIAGGGHLNAESALGSWPSGRALLDRLLERTALSRAG